MTHVSEDLGGLEQHLKLTARYTNDVPYLLE